MHNIHTVDVLWPDCDPAGIVFYGNYFRWMDDASHHLFVQAKLARVRLGEAQSAHGMPLVAAHADFRTPATFGDVMKVESHVSEFGTTSFTVVHQFSVDGRMTAEGWEKRVWVISDPDDPTKMKPVPVPDDVRDALGGTP